ncbi:hypothetical protein SLEP1_g33991 [Rubroshorea leprosula]|uniref:Uncharacterized protein n=1 Tax=Rubroshorea leprosula TaxID=152421 RepID=A0AAV5KID8_9ROSI|nr:hypothetical protein SLEP1_g33991 [Rubroshorea leprosula]
MHLLQLHASTQVWIVWIPRKFSKCGVLKPIFCHLHKQPASRVQHQLPFTSKVQNSLVSVTSSKPGSIIGVTVPACYNRRQAVFRDLVFCDPEKDEKFLIRWKKMERMRMLESLQESEVGGGRNEEEW